MCNEELAPILNGMGKESSATLRLVAVIREYQGTVDCSG
jgi:hypothetical protein